MLVNLDKLICDLLESKKCSDYLSDIIKALEKQGLDYKNGKIIRIK